MRGNINTIAAVGRLYGGFSCNFVDIQEEDLPCACSDVLVEGHGFHAFPYRVDR